MQTYPIKIIRTVFASLTGEHKYVRFTFYNKKGPPHKVKAKLLGIVAHPEGLSIISGSPTYVNRQCIPFRCTFAVKDIRWIDIPFDEKRFEDLCSQYVKKLAPNNGRMISLPESALLE